MDSGAQQNIDGLGPKKADRQSVPTVAAVENGRGFTLMTSRSLYTSYEGAAKGGNGRAAFAPPTVNVSRRHPVEMSLPLAVNGGHTSIAVEESGIDGSSPLDVPAFLRRQN